MYFHRLIKNISLRTGIIFINQLSMFLMILIAGNRLDNYHFGVASIGLIILQIFYAFSEWGFSIDSINEINNSYPKSKLVSEIIYSKLFIFSTLMIITIIFLSIKFEIISTLIIFWLFVAAFFSSQNNLWYFQATNQVNKVLKYNFFGRIISILIFIFLLNKNDDIYIIFLSQAVAFCIPCIYGYYFIYRQTKFDLSCDIKLILMRLKKSFFYFITNISHNYLHTFWGILLFNQSPVSIGYFNLSDQLLRSGNYFGNIITESLLTNYDKYRVISNIKYILFSLLAIFLVIQIYIDDILFLFFNNKFNDSIIILRVTTISWFFLSLIKLLGYPVLGKKYSSKFFDKINLIYLFISLLIIFLYSLFFKINLLLISFTFLILSLCYLLLIIFFIFRDYNKG